MTRETSRHSSPRWPRSRTPAISWLGFLVHNVADLPDQTFLSPETLWPSVVIGALLVVYAAGLERIAGFGLLIWSTLNLAGGILTVLPLPLLPFEPEQTLRHYSFHVLYAGTQIPLLLVSWRLALGGPGRPDRGEQRLIRKLPT